MTKWKRTKMRERERDGGEEELEEEEEEEEEEERDVIKMQTFNTFNSLEISFLFGLAFKEK